MFHIFGGIGPAEDRDTVGATMLPHGDQGSMPRATLKVETRRIALTGGVNPSIMGALHEQAFTSLKHREQRRGLACSLAGPRAGGLPATGGASPQPARPAPLPGREPMGHRHRRLPGIAHRIGAGDQGDRRTWPGRPRAGDLPADEPAPVAQVLRLGARDVFAPSQLARLGAVVDRELRETESRHLLRELHGLLGRTSDACVITDLEGQITYWNRSAPPNSTAGAPRRSKAVPSCNFSTTRATASRTRPARKSCVWGNGAENSINSRATACVC